MTDISKGDTVELNLPFSTYVHKPFSVQAVEVTTDNIEQIAMLVGTLERGEDGVPFILVDPTKVEKVRRVFPGFYMTQMGKKIRCYSKKVFLREFMKETPEIQTLMGLNAPSTTVAEAPAVYAQRPPVGGTYIPGALSIANPAIGDTISPEAMHAAISQDSVDQNRDLTPSDPEIEAEG